MLFVWQAMKRLTEAEKEKQRGNEEKEKIHYENPSRNEPPRHQEHQRKAGGKSPQLGLPMRRL
jgi:hypothetical protein